MKLGQTRVNGAATAALFKTADAACHPGTHRAGRGAGSVSDAAALLRIWSRPEPILPIHPPEVWGCGCTYETSATFRDAEHGTREGMYAHVYREARPEVFFKGTARHCVGTTTPSGSAPIPISPRPSRNSRSSSAPGHSIFGFTLANDVSAWDIERENALYLTQSKVYERCCALGPVIVTADSIADPYGLDMTCTVTRAGNMLFEAPSIPPSCTAAWKHWSSF